MKQRSTTRSAGLSLIELLVAMAIGLVLTLAVTSVLIRSEGSKRSSTSVNDINQSGAYAAYTLDRVIRSAGSGFSQNWRATYGCRLNTSRGGVALLPLPAPIATTSAFTNVTLPIRLAPLIIGKNLADTAGATRGDVLMVMAGMGGVGEAPQPVTSKPDSVTDTNLSVPTGLGYVTGDMILLANASASPAGDCALDQVGGTHVAGNAGQDLPLGGTYHRDNSAYSADATLAYQLGHTPEPGFPGESLPHFKLYGVGPDSTLVSYDLLLPAPPDLQISDGIVELRALYGIDTSATPDGVLDAWVDATGEYAAPLLTDGSLASQTKLGRIVAVRVGMILRTTLKERTPSSTSGAVGPEAFTQSNAASRTLFADLPGLTYTRALGADTGYRFRSVESTIPLRNVLLADRP